ncbi:MAG: hypothetical protein HKN32_06585 [Flavobacteriales bacterium]|nr:hypothetical protein [Flavobacteriales bacterium]
MISSIKHKINTLAEQRTELATRVESLEGENQRLASQVGELRAQLTTLTDKNKVLKMAKSLNDGDDSNESNTDTKHKINELVREIDKCIALLNK